MNLFFEISILITNFKCLLSVIENYFQVSTSEGSSLAGSYKTAFHEISVAENPQQLDRLLNTAILQLRGEEEEEQEKNRKMTLWTLTRVLTNMLGGGRGSLPPEVGRGEKEKATFKTVFKKRSV